MYLIKNAVVYDPQPKGINDVLVVNDRIAAVGKDLNPQIPTIKEIDGSGKTVVPGFIDQHVHVTGGGGEGGFHTRTCLLYTSHTGSFLNLWKRFYLEPITSLSTHP